MKRYIKNSLSHYFPFPFILSILWEEWVGSFLETSQVFDKHFKTWTTTLDIVFQLWSHFCLTQKTGTLLLLFPHCLYLCWGSTSACVQCSGNKHKEMMPNTAVTCHTCKNLSCSYPCPAPCVSPALSIASHYPQSQFASIHRLTGKPLKKASGPLKTIVLLQD